MASKRTKFCNHPLEFQQQVQQRFRGVMTDADRCRCGRISFLPKRGEVRHTLPDYEIRHVKVVNSVEEVLDIAAKAQPGGRLWKDPYRDRPDLDMSTSGMPLKPGT